MGGEIFLILFVVLILFGADKLPEIARGLGKGLNEIRKATDDIKSEITNSTSGIRDEMNSIRSDLTNSANDARQGFDNLKTELNNTVTETKNDLKDIGTDSGLSVYEEIQRSEEAKPEVANADATKKTDNQDNNFIAANI